MSPTAPPDHTTPGSTTTPSPVTVSFTRRANPAQAKEMTAWIRSGLTLAEAFPGFLGGGWVRTKGGSDEWHMLCRFDSSHHLEHWEASPERHWWLGSAQGMAQVTRTERRTGIEGWFDPAESTELDHARRRHPRAGSRPPPSGWGSSRSTWWPHSPSGRCWPTGSWSPGCCC